MKVWRPLSSPFSLYCIEFLSSAYHREQRVNSIPLRWRKRRIYGCSLWRHHETRCAHHQHHHYSWRKYNQGLGNGNAVQRHKERTTTRNQIGGEPHTQETLDDLELMLGGGTGETICTHDPIESALFASGLGTILENLGGFDVGVKTERTECVLRRHSYGTAASRRFGWCTTAGVWMLYHV